MTVCSKCHQAYTGKVYSGDRCEPCYRRELRISRGLRVTTTVAERILSRVIEGPNGCQLFTGCDNGNGYKKIHVGGRQGGRRYVHRVMFELTKGPIPPGLHIDHLCRNRACVNPDHLEAVTQAENNRRAVAANRNSDATPERKAEIQAQVAELQGGAK